MASLSDESRRRSFGQDHDLTPVDRLGIWLSSRRIRRTGGTLVGKRVADIGCGYHAQLARSFVGDVSRLLLLDVALDPGLRSNPKVTAIEGHLPEALEDVPERSQDVVICNSVLEHVWDAEACLRGLRRILAPSGTLLLNVPSWRGKSFLEFSAFRLRTSPAEEMDDHKMYYDPRDLWPSLVRAGFRPRGIRCFRHKFGLNTFAVCHEQDDV
ncbi:MAG: methyltransferase domain-containing protein [Candidatus Dormibacteraeota bacterium]|nr:methyltransferase domain-containing protein [Candidatus Dormibacteraeota bacterium]